MSASGTCILLILAATFFWSFSGVCVKSMPGVSRLLITGYPTGTCDFLKHYP
ncbi:MAG: hypothetical protein GX569_04510 [Candidatus Riflebacteria bacterium]|nr:hypothetical protein [Candidatus Riflebacteria bacterium]